MLAAPWATLDLSVDSSVLEGEVSLVHIQTRRGLGSSICRLLLFRLSITAHNDEPGDSWKSSWTMAVERAQTALIPKSGGRLSQQGSTYAN